MTKLAEALAWSGRDTAVSLFALHPTGTQFEVVPPVRTTAPAGIRRYDLDDVDDRVPGWACTEIDLIFDQLPADLDLVVSAWVGAALAAGASLVWCAFEGSFDFDHILTADVADQVFAVGTRDGVELAIDDDRREGQPWATVLEHVRSKVIS